MSLGPALHFTTDRAASQVRHRVELDHILRQHWNPTLWKSPVFSSSERPVFIHKSGDLQKILY